MLTLSISEQASNTTIFSSTKEEISTSFRKETIFSLIVQKDPISSASLDNTEGGNHFFCFLETHKTKRNHYHYRNRY